MLFIGVAVLLTTVLIVLLVGYYLMKIPYDDLVGVASGATGNPAILVYSTRMAPTERPDIGYAMIFPSMTIVKVIAVQIVGLLMSLARADVGVDDAGCDSDRSQPARWMTTADAEPQHLSRHVRRDHAGDHGRPRRGERRQAGIDGSADRAGVERAGRRIHFVRRDLCDDGERGKHRDRDGDGAALSAALPYGIVRLLTGLVFSVGLILVVVGGAELFTGNNLIVMAWASGKVKTRACCSTGSSRLPAISSARSRPPR